MNKRCKLFYKGIGMKYVRKWEYLRKRPCKSLVVGSSMARLSRRWIWLIFSIPIKIWGLNWIPRRMIIWWGYKVWIYLLFRRRRCRIRRERRWWAMKSKLKKVLSRKHQCNRAALPHQRWLKLSVAVPCRKCHLWQSCHQQPKRRTFPKSSEVRLQTQILRNL